MSLANYVIICDAEIGVLSTDNVPEKIRFASNGAKDVVTFLELSASGVTDADTKPVSDIQHDLMDGIHTMKKEEAEAKIQELFTALRVLEKKFSGHNY